MLRFEIALGSEIKYEEFLAVDRECFPREPVVSRGVFEEYLKDKFWTVRLDGKLAAYSHVSFKESAHIHRIAVIGRYRRKGIASRLVEIALNSSKKMSFSKITLAVEKSNEAALELYKKHDFEEVGDLFQYIAPLHRRTASEDKKPRTRVLSIGDLSETLRAILPSEWDYIVEQHSPPRKFALLFVEGESTIKGITRLVADLPGCSPFILLEPHLDLPSVIDSIGSYLSSTKDELILTFPDEDIARACQKAGFKLQYEMVRMEREIE
ncbi:GNAT family N-acetyltransferase [candidate division WOR-3 bacterium]|nr:GNAT family N-acetyltransferase [candidate division WOR-3 bacterium]